MTQPGRKRPRVVIIGGGFAGLAAAKSLRGGPADVVVLDRSNFHLFQPLLYQVATAALSPANVAAPIRKALRRMPNATVLLGEVRSIDLAAHAVQFDSRAIHYDYLIVATGARHSYFASPQWEAVAPGLKTVQDALKIRRQFLMAFERAELEDDEAARRAALTFIVVGGGPTGVELAGAMAEIAHKVIPRDFRRIDTSTARVTLVEAGDRILSEYPPTLSARAVEHLNELGVDVRINSRVTNIDSAGINIGAERIDASNVIWAAGVQASPLGRALGTEVDRAGRVAVADDLSVPGHPNVFVIGDLAHVLDPASGHVVPGVAPAAQQMGRYVGRLLRRELAAHATGGAAPPRAPFRYVDKGMLATIGRNRAVAVVRGMRFSGRAAWLLWALVHVLFLINFRNKIVVLIDWIWMYFFFERGARLITEDCVGPDEYDEPVAIPARSIPDA